MEQNTTKYSNIVPDPYFEESQAKTKLSFDFALWFYRILKYWYLFVISLALFLSYAYLKNKSWTPRFRSGATLMMEARGNEGVSFGAVNFGNRVRNSVDQQMILSSHNLVKRTVDKLPQMRVSYFRENKFKTDNLYGITPVVIDAKFVAESAHAFVFKIEPINSEKCRIFYEGTETRPPFSMDVVYGQFVQEPRFYIKIDKTDRFYPDFVPFSFRFITKDELIGKYAGRITTAFPQEGSSALDVSIFGENPNQDVEFLQTLLNEFQEYNLKLKNEAADRTIAYIDKQMGMISDSLYHSEELFREFQDETGIYRLENSDNRVLLQELTMEQAKLKAQEDLILQVTEEINNSIEESTELLDPAGLGLTDNRFSESIANYNRLLKVINNMGEAHPMYSKNLQALKAVQIKILEELRVVQNKAKEKDQDLEIKRTELRDKISTLPAQEREYIRYEKIYNVNDAYYTYLRQKRYDASLQKASNTPDNYIMEEARQLGGAVNGDERTETYTFFFVIGLAIPLLFVICKEEVFNYVISTKEDCEKLSGLPVIGTIENVSKKMSSGGATLVKNFPKSSFAESFRNMRIRIEYMAQKEIGISLMITSAEPGDGKTFIAGNIASVYQLTGKRVVLVDFDLRRPSVSKLLNIQSKKGVSNLLIGQVELDDVIITHPEYEFDVIPAGTLPPNPSELIKTKKAKDLLDHLRAKYDYVIVDCSPIGLVSDAYILSRYMDTTLFVVRRAKTNKSFFKSVITQMKNDGLDHVALIFNDVKGREGYYGTSRYYGNKSYYLKRNSYYHDDYFEK